MLHFGCIFGGKKKAHFGVELQKLGSNGYSLELVVHSAMKFCKIISKGKIAFELQIVRVKLLLKVASIIQKDIVLECQEENDNKRTVNGKYWM